MNVPYKPMNAGQGLAPAEGLHPGGHIGPPLRFYTSSTASGPPSPQGEGLGERVRLPLEGTPEWPLLTYGQFTFKLSPLGD